MATLYIDVDDTLVVWTSDGESWTANKAVIEFAKQWKGDIVVWSGGGLDYAQMWARHLLQSVKWVASPKFNPVVKDGDVFIDDSPFKAWEHATIRPWELF